MIIGLHGYAFQGIGDDRKLVSLFGQSSNDKYMQVQDINVKGLYLS